MNENRNIEKGKAYNSIPDWMRSSGNASRVLFLDLRDKKADLNDPKVRDALRGSLRDMQAQAFGGKPAGQCIIKVHIGEPLIKTSIIPSLAESTVDFLKSSGVDRMAFGDTTVLYSSRRGGHENPHGSEKAYIDLIRERGWSGLSAPFVILDRPATSVKGVFEFDKGALTMEAGPPGRYVNVFAAGAIESAGTFIQHAHMTGHMLSGLACCIKGIAMGVANRRGKAQMHLSLRPSFNEELCSMCGDCADRCPENAIDFSPGNVPTLLDERCLGCGQCLAECEQKAIEMKALESYAGYNWGRGAPTIHSRMTDYAVGMMQGLWDSMLHVAHLVRMTPGCDCFNRLQTPACDDIGFLIGRNPFAVDKAGMELVIERLGGSADKEMQRNIDTIREGDPYTYVSKTYGINTEAEIDVVPFSC